MGKKIKYFFPIYRTLTICKYRHILKSEKPSLDLSSLKTKRIWIHIVKVLKKNEEETRSLKEECLHMYLKTFSSPGNKKTNNKNNKTFLIHTLESVQDFLIKLDIKPLMRLSEISTFSLNNVIVRLTKIMNRADKNWAHF